MSTRKSRAPRSPSSSPAPPVGGRARDAAAEADDASGGDALSRSVAGQLTIRVMPLQYYLRQVFNTADSDKTPYSGKYFGNSQIVEHKPHEIVIHSGMSGAELGMAVKMSLSAKKLDWDLVTQPAQKMDGDYSMEIKQDAKGGYTLAPSAGLMTILGRSAVPTQLGLYALNYPANVKGSVSETPLSPQLRHQHFRLQAFSRART
eukprot:SAG31_NODE_2533_length_5554_cov_2.350623_2_plen_204_part_00